MNSYAMVKKKKNDINSDILDTICKPLKNEKGVLILAIMCKVYFFAYSSRLVE